MKGIGKLARDIDMTIPTGLGMEQFLNVIMDTQPVLIATIVNVILNTLLIPIWGLEEAAMTNAASTITRNMLLGIRVHRRLGIYPGAFGTFSFRRSES